MQHEFRAGFLFSGMGALAHGVMKAQARLGADVARFTFAGAVDVNPIANKAFEYLTGFVPTLADVAQLTYEDMRRIFGPIVPDCFFLSPPCKGFSQLLPTASSQLEHYQRLNRLVLQSVELLMAWGGDKDWTKLPGLIFIENVQGILTRGSKLLLQVKQLLHAKGYVFDEAVHDLGHFNPDPNAKRGGPAHRPRYLLVARHPKKVPAFIHNPPKLPLRGCGEVLFDLPLPDDPDAGPLHKSPRSALVTLLRLAAIPKGKDHRALPQRQPVDPEARKAWEQEGKKLPGGGPFLFKGKHQVMDPEKPARTVVAGTSNGADVVSDPRVGQLSFDHGKRPGSMKVMNPAEPADMVRGVSKADNGPGSLSDPRVPELLAPTTQRKGRHKGHYGVSDPKKPMGTVTGREGVWEGAPALADPRVSMLAPTEGHGTHTNKHFVGDGKKPARTVTGATRPGSGGAAVSDPRVQLLATNQRPNRFHDQYRVQDGNQPARTVTGRTDIQEGAPVVSDSRVEQLLGRDSDSRPNLLAVLDPEKPALTVTANASVSGGNSAAALSDHRLHMLAGGDSYRNGFMGVIDPDSPAPTVTASLDPYCGTAAVSDARQFRRGKFGRIILTFTQGLDLLEKGWKVPTKELPPCIPSPHDGEWHRALTKYDLWTLQGLPLKVRGKVPELPGTEADQRELIGDAVPVPSAQMLGISALTAQLASALGTWSLSPTGYWVRRDDGYVQEDPFIEFTA